jgi:hypothetical protein
LQQARTGTRLTESCCAAFSEQASGIGILEEIDAYCMLPASLNILTFQLLSSCLFKGASHPGIARPMMLHFIRDVMLRSRLQ